MLVKMPVGMWVQFWAFVSITQTVGLTGDGSSNWDPETFLGDLN